MIVNLHKIKCFSLLSRCEVIVLITEKGYHRKHAGIRGCNQSPVKYFRDY
jgi:hypothetical protein